MGGHARHQTVGLGAALALHLFVYCAVGGAFFFGMYELLQPTRFNNPGVAYDASPKRAIAYGSSSGFPPPPDATTPQPITTDHFASQLEPKVRSAFAHA